MKRKITKSKWKREDIINAIIKMRVEEMATTKTIIDFLMNDLHYGQTYAYELVKDSREKIKKLYDTNNIAVLEEALAHLEEMLEMAKREKNRKMQLEVRKEINKLLGLYAAEKVEVSGQVQIQTIKLKEIRKDDGSIGD
jgi:ribosomal protein S7